MLWHACGFALADQGADIRLIQYQCLGFFWNRACWGRYFEDTIDNIGARLGISARRFVTVRKDVNNAKKRI
jgi:hypothetical protein